MKRAWMIIPDYHNMQESLKLAEEYDAAFEYNDFFDPAVYTDEEEVKKRISFYKNCPGKRERDTLHGVFLDNVICSQDSVIRAYSRKRAEQSMDIAQQLEVRGVVFHSGLIAGLKQKAYLDNWYKGQEEWIRYLLDKYPGTDIYMENTFENEPDSLLALAARLQDCRRFQLCLDYGHACLTPTPPEQWMNAMAFRIGHMHLNDNDLKADWHMVPGEGAIDLGQFRAALEKHNIHCPILLEVTGADKQRKALQYMNRL